MSLLKIILETLLLVTCSCANNSSDGYFTKDGVSFTYPTDWSITEQENLGRNSYYLSVEKKGIYESGLVIITWINGNIGKHEYLRMIQESYKNQKLFNDLEFETAKNITFNGIQSISCVYYCSTLGVKIKGVVYVFLIGEKTFSFTKQGALEDISKNKKGFELIESTFKIE
ncbi:MAG: hypothetical protein ACOCWG_06310 [bacterium]